MTTTTPTRRPNAERYVRRRMKTIPGVAPAVELRPVEKPRSDRPPLGRVLAEVAVLCLWCVFWLLNGWATVNAAQAVGAWLAAYTRLHRTPGEWTVLGVTAHAMFTLIEQNLWRGDAPLAETLKGRVAVFFGQTDRLRLSIVVLVGALDSLSSAWWLVGFAVDAGVQWGFPLVASCSIMAGLVAMAAEPMIRNFAHGLLTLYRRSP